MESIGRIQRRELLEYVQRNYNGRSTFVTVAGKCRHDDVVEMFRSGLEALPIGANPEFEPWNGSKRNKRLIVATEDTEQTHLALGYHAISRTDDRRHALKLLSVSIGENMSSRLFQPLRERYAFCYSINSGTLVLEDSGLVSICVGLESVKLRRGVGAIDSEVEKVPGQAPAQKELRGAQE